MGQESAQPICLSMGSGLQRSEPYKLESIVDTAIHLVNNSTDSISFHSPLLYSAPTFTFVDRCNVYTKLSTKVPPYFLYFMSVKLQSQAYFS